MAFRPIGPGDDVEAWCTRCRMNLNHRVIAVAAGEIQKVQCLTCGGDHKYHPPKGAKTAERGRTALKEPRSPRERKSSARSAADKALSEWTTFLKEMTQETVTRPYRITEAYSKGEYIEHPGFGVGRVLDVVGAERIEVIFREGRKVMVCNRKKDESPAS